MIHLIAGNRDIGQCEVSRLLFSDPFATKKSMIDFYRTRKKNTFLIPHLDKVINFIEFVRFFKIVKNEIKLRESPETVVVTMYPRIRYNPLNIDK
jgi:hypothetical protein